MKRTPLKRKSRLKNISPLKEVIYREYVKLKKAHPPKRKGMEPHHPFGRIGIRLLCFVWIDKDLHQRIHDNGAWARESGWLQPEFDSRRGSAPRPWRLEDEKWWPDKYKRKE